MDEYGILRPGNQCKPPYLPSWWLAPALTKTEAGMMNQRVKLIQPVLFLFPFPFPTFNHT